MMANSHMKRYTKKQIKEAIDFWKVILENKSPLLDDLVDEYGYGIVFYNVPIHLTMKQFDVLFDAINHNLFSNMLQKWPFIKNDIECNAANALCGYVPDLISNVEQKKYDVVLEEMTINNEVYVPPHYAFSSRLVDGHECSLILAASLMAHEMIHQFNLEHEDEGSIWWLSAAHSKDYDPHGKNFERWMDRANAIHGLHVQKHGQGLNVVVLSKNAVDAVNAFAGQDYVCENDNEDNYKILKRNEDCTAFTVFIK